MTQLPDLNSIKQELNEQHTNSKSPIFQGKKPDLGFDDLLTQNLDFAESLQLLAKSGKLASSKISVKTKFDKKTTDILKNWLIKNIDNPYPSDEVKEKLCEMTGLNKKQIQNWFTNTRKRYVQPLKRKLRNEAIAPELSSETGGSQNEQDNSNFPRPEENLKKPQSSSTIELSERPLATNMKNNALPTQVLQISHSTAAPIIFPNQFLLPSLDGSHVPNNVAIGGVAFHQQRLQIPQISYANTLAPQTLLIDRSLLNIDQITYVELQKEDESKKKSLRTFIINESLKVALQVMTRDKAGKWHGSEDFQSSGDESEEIKQRNKQRRQDLEAYLHQITKRVHVA